MAHMRRTTSQRYSRLVAVLVAALMALSAVSGCDGNASPGGSGPSRGSSSSSGVSHGPTKAEAAKALADWYRDDYQNDPAYNDGGKNRFDATADQVEVLDSTGYTSRWSNDLTYPVRAEVSVVGTDGDTGEQLGPYRIGRSDNTLFLLYRDSRKGAKDGWSVEPHTDDGTIIPTE